jgi:hypothetical protein
MFLTFIAGSCQFDVNNAAVQAGDVEAGCQAVGALRRKPGRGDATLSMSCSDKLSRWCCLGVQGSLLSGLLSHPIYLSTLTLSVSVPPPPKGTTASTSKAALLPLSHTPVVGATAFVPPPPQGTTASTSDAVSLPLSHTPVWGATVSVPLPPQGTTASTSEVPSLPLTHTSVGGATISVPPPPQGTTASTSKGASLLLSHTPVGGGTDAAAMIAIQRALDGRIRIQGGGAESLHPPFRHSPPMAAVVPLPEAALQLGLVAGEKRKSASGGDKGGEDQCSRRKW